MENNDKKIESPYINMREEALKQAHATAQNPSAMEQFLTSLDNMTLQLEYGRRWVGKQTDDIVAIIEESSQPEEDKTKLIATKRMEYDKSEQALERHIAFVNFIRADLGL